MKMDILLRQSGASTWDWTFDGHDVVTVQGTAQLVQRCKHAVLLRPDELVQSIYNGCGCHIHDYALRENHEYIDGEKESAVEQTIRGLNGVSEAQCTLEQTGQFDNKIQVTIITDDMEVVTIDEL